MRDLNELARKAATQHGLLTVGQLRDLGCTRRSIDRLLGRGFLERHSRGVVVVAGTPVSWEQDVMRACLASTPMATTSHRTALRLWGMRMVDDDIDVSVRYPRNQQSRWATVHRSRDLRPADVTWIEGLPVTTPARTLCDAGLVLPASAVRRLVQHAVSVGIVTSSDLLGYRRRVGRQGRTGVGALDRAIDGLELDGVDAESGPEIELRRLLREAGVPPGVPQHPVVAGGRRARIDLAYPDQRLAVEFDGYAAHSSHDRFVDDRRRQNSLYLAGWTVLRFTGDDLRHRPHTIVTAVRRALAATNPVL